MLFGLLMSTSIPDAFGGRALPFAIGVAALQVGRTAFLAFALRQGGQMPQYRNFVRIGIWFAIAAIFWIAGALADPETRLYLWGGALVAELATAFIGFWLPGLGRSTTRDWSVSGEHMAERCGLFVIIALGEAVMIAGATFTELAWTTPHTLAFLAAVIAAIAMWWIYFNIGAERAAHHFAHSEDPGALARTAYTYIHMPLVAGIVAMAVAVELALAHPQGHMEPAMRWTACGAAFLFIGGNTLFKRATAGWFPLSHLAGLAIAVALFLAAPGLTPLQMIVAVAALLVTVATWETVSLRGTADRA
jgi:low temperature requirement protein LtrA